jgi:hypothetical protein
MTIKKHAAVPVKPVMLADLRYTDARGRECWKIKPKIKVRNSGGLRGYDLYAPYDYEHKRFLDEPIGEWRAYPYLWPANSPWQVWLWLKSTDVQWYQEHTGARGVVLWERKLNKRRLKEVERKLDMARSDAA